MPTDAPVPMAAMRSGSESEAPGAVTRTGRIAWMPWFGRSFIARKSKPSFTYWSMIGFTSAGIWKPLSASHWFSALESVACSCTVAYGPTFSCFVTVTPPPAPSCGGAARAACAEVPRQLLGGPGSSAEAA